MNMKNAERYKKIGSYYEKIQKLQNYLARDDWNFTGQPRAYIGSYDNGNTSDYCRLHTFENKDMKQLFREQWQRYINQFETEIEKLKKEIADEDKSS